MNGFGAVRRRECWGWPRVVQTAIEDLKPLVVGEDPFLIERIWQKLYASTQSHGMTGVVGSGAITGMPLQFSFLATFFETVLKTLWTTSFDQLFNVVHHVSSVAAYVAPQCLDEQRPVLVRLGGQHRTPRAWRLPRIRRATSVPAHDRRGETIVRRTINDEVTARDFDPDQTASTKENRRCEPPTD